MISTHIGYDDIRDIQKAAYKIKGNDDNYLPLLDLVGEAHLVLLGEATHGTHEFYQERAQITKQLIQKKGFRAVVIEGDWPDAYRVHRYVVGRSLDQNATQALEGFTRFPSWMWSNTDSLDFVNWLHDYNRDLPLDTQPVAFYGLDLYSLFRSAREILAYLEGIDTQAAQRARLRFDCLERFGGDSQKYAYMTSLGLEQTCEDAVVKQLIDLLKSAVVYRSKSESFGPVDEYFNAEQNSRLVAAAEHYYRTMLSEDVSSWNLRDHHMMDTIDNIRTQLLRGGILPKIVVWAHNSHIGNASATEMAKRGEINVGQLAKEKFKDEAVSIGFTTYFGTVTAATHWGGPCKQHTVRPAIDDSYESLFHSVAIPRFFLNLREHPKISKFLSKPLLERAIGVIYRPETERMSHYFHASLPLQYDAVIHFDQTSAVEPLESDELWELGGEVSETYPSGI